MKPICLASSIKNNKLFEYKKLLIFKDSLNNLRTLPSTCPHLGYSFSNLCPKDNSVVCPYHSYSFNSNYAQQAGIFEYAGIIWEDIALSQIREEQGFPTSLLSKLQTSKWREFSIHCNWKHLLANLVDYSHFSVVHNSLGGKGLSKPQITELGKNLIEIEWLSDLPRPTTSLVELFIGSRGMVSRVPFFDTYLNNISFVVENSKDRSTLLTNFWFEKEEYDTNPWIRFWTNRVVDLLVYEDKKILEKIAVQKPDLEREQNPLIKRIYYEDNL